jgi:hypothetical protein
MTHVLLPPIDQPSVGALAAATEADQAAVAALSLHAPARLAALSLAELSSSAAAAAAGPQASSPTAGFRVDAEPSQQQLMGIACRQPSMPEPLEMPEDVNTARLAAAQQQADDVAAAVPAPDSAGLAAADDVSGTADAFNAVQPVQCASPTGMHGMVDGSAVAAAAAAASVGRGVNVLSQSLDLGAASGNPQLVLQVLQKLQRLPEPLLLEIVQRLVQVRGRGTAVKSGQYCCTSGAGMCSCCST